MQINYILMDIEGTTTDMAFVHEVLFPYSQKHLRPYLAQHKNEFEINKILAQVKLTLNQEGQSNITDEQLISTLESWIVNDRKHPALKTLQGYIWEAGYNSGELKSHVYPDVLPCWKNWKAQGIHLGIYSSGSVKAQHLLFGHTEMGDVRSSLEHFFDTQVGGKKEKTSYLNILQILERKGPEVLFLSDVEAELDAAKAALMITIQLVRPGTIASEKHPNVQSFEQIRLL